MNNKIKISLLAIVLLLSVSYFGCDIKNPVDGLAVIFNTLPINTTASVQVVDAKTGEQVGYQNSETVTIAFQGKDKDKIINLIEEPVTSLKTKTGVANFAIKNDVTPTAANPVKFTIVVSANGYISNSIPVTIKSSGDKSYSINMVKTSAPPQGSSTSDETNVPTDQSGNVTTETTVQTNEESTSGGTASVTIPSGTQVSDSEGRPVKGNLSLTAYYVNPNSGNDLTSLPGGSLSASVVDQQGTTQDGFIEPMALASFDLTNDSGEQIHNFSSPIELTMEIPAGTINKSTNEIIKNGDSVPVYSYDQDNGVWKYETDGVAEGPNSKGNFDVKFQTTHLSWWLVATLNTTTICNKNLVLNVVGDFTSLEVKLYADNTYMTSVNLTSNQKHFEFQNLSIPSNTPVKAVAYSRLECPAQQVGSVEVSDLCSVDTVNLDVSSSSDIVDVNVQTTAICRDRDPELRFRPDGYAIYIDNGCSLIQVGTLHDGAITLKGFKLNSSYTFKLEYKEAWYDTTVVVDKTFYDIDYVLDNSVCKDF